MIITAHQSAYLPWLGLFHKIYISDLYCYLDIVQYQRGDYNNRNKIKTSSGELWLSIPIESKNHFNTRLCDARIIRNGWNKKHLKSIYINYKKSTFFEIYYQDIERFLMKEYTFLSDLNFDMLVYFLSCLNISTKIIRASDYDFEGNKSNLILDICKKAKGDKFIFGEQGLNYVDTSLFSNNGIKIFFQKYIHPTYRQLWGNFLPYLSIIDLLFNEGPLSKKILLSSNIEKSCL